MTTNTTRTEQDGTITYAIELDGVRVSFLDIDATTRMVWNVETMTGFERQGFASALWAAANAEAECFHALDHHRTTDGDAFAHAVGGETISDADGFVAECCVCTDTDY